MTWAFHSLNDFLFMNGHGLYVWSAYAFMLLVLMWNLWIPVRDHRKLCLRLKRRWMMAAKSSATDDFKA